MANQHEWRTVNNKNASRPKNKYQIFGDHAAELSIHPYSCYDIAFPQFQQPVEIGTILSDTRQQKIDSNENGPKDGYKYLGND